jgi:hypothetical protein
MMDWSRTLSSLVIAAAVSAGAGCALELEGGQSGGDVDVRDADVFPASRRCAVVTTSEFGLDGAVAIVDAESLEVWPDVTATHGDANVDVIGEEVFVINREGGDSIQALDSAERFRTRWQRTTGAGTNPWRMVHVAEGPTWVSLYNEGALQRVEPDAGSGASFLVGDRVVIPWGQEADERAEPLGLFVRDGVLYVITQGLGEYPRCGDGDRGALLAFDALTLAPRPVFGGSVRLELAACNPVDFAFLDDDTLLIAHAGRHRVTGGAHDDGGIELVDVAAGSSDGLIATEADYGDRDIVALAFDGVRLWVAAAGADFSASVFPASVEPFGAGEPVWWSDEAGIFALEVDRDQVWVVDRSYRSPGLVVFDAATSERIAGPLSTGFPPFDIAFVTVPGGSCMQ